MNQPLASAALDQLFLEARTFSANPNPWLDRAVPDALLQQIWALARMGPTAANMSPMRVVFVRSAARQRMCRFDFRSLGEHWRHGCCATH